MQFNPHERGALAQALRDASARTRVGYLSDATKLEMVKAVEGWLDTLPVERVERLAQMARARAERMERLAQAEASGEDEGPPAPAGAVDRE